VVPPELVHDLAPRQLTVVSQPHFVAERGDDYRREVDPGDLGSLYRLRSLSRAGVALAAGTDAPFGGGDPWPSIAAAVSRRTRGGHSIGDDEGLDVTAAVALFLGTPEAPGRPRRLEVGQPADLCLLGVAWRDLPEVLGDVPVAATFLAGTPAFLAR
jgi:predicted amidohydrolase YtcJ